MQILLQILKIMFKIVMLIILSLKTALKMANFKNLSKNILSKILFGFLLLSFILFGISSFLLQDSGNWVAKIDGKKISYQKLEKSVNSQKQIILNNNPNNSQAVAYVNSARFKIDVLSKIINEKMIETISNRYGIYPSRIEILTNITKNPNFHKKGKFDHKYFKSLLADNGLTEEDYIKTISNETINTMIVNSVGLVSPIDKEITDKITNLEEEIRYADLITIHSRNASAQKIKPPQDLDLQIIYETNSKLFDVVEKRDLQYVAFDRSALTRGVFASNKKIREFYEENKAKFRTKQSRDFYHIAFNDRVDAEEFLKRLEEANGDKEKAFIKLGKELAKKSKKQLLVTDITIDDSIPEVAEQVFQRSPGQHSGIFQSDLGYHIVLTKTTRDGQYLKYSQVRKEIKKQLTEKLQREAIENKLNQINESLLENNTLAKAAQKFRLGKIKTIKNFTFKQPKFEGYYAKQARKIQDFAKNAFELEKDKVSTLIESDNKIYAILVKNVTNARTKTFVEVKNQLRKIYYQKQKSQNLLNLTKKVLEELNQNPVKAYRIAKKYGLRVNRNKAFTKTKKIKVQGKEYETSNAFLKDLFDIKINQVTNYHQGDDGKSYQIAILKKTITPKLSFNQINKHRTKLSESYRKGFIQSFNRYIEEEHEVKINNKFIAAMQNQQQPNQ